MFGNKVVQPVQQNVGRAVATTGGNKKGGVFAFLLHIGLFVAIILIIVYGILLLTIGLNADSALPPVSDELAQLGGALTGAP